MVERKLFKTKLCILYQKGHCPRQSCSFAHGNAELRRFSGSFNGRRESRDYRGSDLRDKLDSKHSPQRKYSPGKDSRSRHSFRGYSRSRSPVKRSERRHGKKQHKDGQSDVSESLKASESAAIVKERKITSSAAKDALEEQLKQLQLDIDMLDDHKSQLEVSLEEKVQEADSLVSKIEELESQLSKEQEDCKRITSKIKKLVKAHIRYSRAQEEVKRSQARLQRLGDQLACDPSRPSANEEDSSVNIMSDGEPNSYMVSPINTWRNLSPGKKRPRSNLGANEEVKPANSRKRHEEPTRVKKLTQWEGPAKQSDNYKEPDAIDKIPIGSNSHRPIENEDNGNKRRKNRWLSMASSEKIKGSELGHALPATSMAAHAVDELVEVTELEEKIEVVEATDTIFEEGSMDKKISLPSLPPPPPPPLALRNAYHKYQGEDEYVDVEELDSGTRDIDINSEVDIEEP